MGRLLGWLLERVFEVLHIMFFFFCSSFYEHPVVGPVLTHSQMNPTIQIMDFMHWQAFHHLLAFYKVPKEFLD